MTHAVKHTPAWALDPANLCAGDPDCKTCKGNGGMARESFSGNSSATAHMIREILAKARAIEPSDDSPLFLGVGAIIANAEDLLDAIEQQTRMHNLRRMHP